MADVFANNQISGQALADAGHMTNPSLYFSACPKLMCISLSCFQLCSVCPRLAMRCEVCEALRLPNIVPVLLLKQLLQRRSSDFQSIRDTIGSWARQYHATPSTHVSKVYYTHYPGLIKVPWGSCRALANVLHAADPMLLWPAAHAIEPRGTKNLYACVITCSESRVYIMVNPQDCQSGALNTFVRPSYDCASILVWSFMLLTLAKCHRRVSIAQFVSHKCPIPQGYQQSLSKQMGGSGFRSNVYLI
jgi:hypothetical protein